MEIIDYIRGINKGGIIADYENKLFTAVTAASSKEFKRLNSAERYMRKFGYTKTLVNEEIQILFNIMIQLLKARNDDRIETVNQDDFKIYIQNIKNQYFEDEEAEDLFKYVEDHIYYDVCCE